MPYQRHAPERYAALVISRLPGGGEVIQTTALVEATGLDIRQVYQGVAAARDAGYPIISYYGWYALAVSESDIEEGYHARFLRDFHAAQRTITSMVESRAELLDWQQGDALRARARQMLNRLYDIAVNGHLDSAEAAI